MRLLICDTGRNKKKEKKITSASLTETKKKNKLIPSKKKPEKP